MARRASASRMPILVPRARPSRRTRKQTAEGGTASAAARDAHSVDNPSDDSRADSPPANGSESSDNFLARYFKEMAALSVLKPEEEFAAARKIEAQELELWGHLLSYPPLADLVLRAAEGELESKPRAIHSLRRLAAEARGRSSAESRRRYSEQAAALAKRLYERDVDRRALFAAMHELTKLARGERNRSNQAKAPVSVRSKTFQRYMVDMRRKYSRAQRSRNEFVKANLRLVVSIARRFNHGRMPLSDLIQEGNMGLIKAVERYDYRKGYRFSTYASWWIRHAISRALADKGRAVRLPVHMIDAHHKVSRTRRELSSKLGRPPTSEEVSAESGIAWDKVRRLEGAMMEQA
jgi:RNA polymerase primary sigma factor